tara:strand:- start:16165 stop:16689 length:525 start_codon:yes stop_codon:yes gene_type:complete
MFNVIIATFFVLLGLAGYSTSFQELEIAGIVSICFGLIWFIVSSIQGFMLYSEQIREFEYLKASMKNLANHRVKTDGLLKEFKYYLAEKFPDMEMKFFKDFLEDKSDMRVMLAYPEFKSHKTIIKLVDKINELTNETHSKLRDIEHKCASIRVNDVSKWSFVKPTIPTEIKEIL